MSVRSWKAFWQSMGFCLLCDIGVFSTVGRQDEGTALAILCVIGAISGVIFHPFTFDD